jgi:uracil phosphoribosyltransferase
MDENKSELQSTTSTGGVDASLTVRPSVQTESQSSDNGSPSIIDLDARRPELVAASPTTTPSAKPPSTRRRRVPSAAESLDNYFLDALTNAATRAATTATTTATSVTAADSARQDNGTPNGTTVINSTAPAVRRKESVDTVGKSRKLKMFTHEEIARRVEERKNDLPEYHDLLMEAAITQDAAGVQFDMTHPSWKKLVATVTRIKQHKKKLLRQHRRKSGRVPNASGSSSKPSTPDASAMSRHQQHSSNNRSRSSHRTRLATITTTQTPTGLSGGDRSVSSPSSAASRMNPGDDNLLQEIAGELDAASPDVMTIRHVCKICGISDAYRGRVWRALLGVRPVVHATAAAHEQEFIAVSFDLPNQQVIRADVDRTFTHMETFRREDTRHDLEVLLTKYCKEYNVSYKQGMNYILAPFFLIGLKHREEIYQCFAAFISKFLSNTFTDDEFGALQCIFRQFELLLQYHDPELAHVLSECDIGPELYASSWFITMYANRLEMDVLLHFWDMLLLEHDDDPLLHYFLSLALLISNRETIMEQDFGMLPAMLSTIRISSTAEIDNLVRKATLLYRSQTAQSVQDRFLHLTRDPIQVESKEWNELKTQPCLLVDAEEIIQFCYNNNDRSPATLKFFVLDCRSKRQYSNGHLPTAFHLDPDLLLRPAELQETVVALASMKNCHICFLNEDGVAGEHASRDSSGVLNLYFRQMGFKYVAMVEGGFAACHRLVMANTEYELVDHKPQGCIECNPRSQNKGLLTVWRRRLTGFLKDSAKDDMKLQYSEDYRDKHVPDTTVQLPNTTELALLHTVMRSKRSNTNALARALVRIASLVVHVALEESGRITEKDVPTSSGGLYTGSELVNPLCGVTVHAVDKILLHRALLPIAEIAHVEFGTVSIDRAPFRHMVHDSATPTASSTISPHNETGQPARASSADAALANVTSASAATAAAAAAAAATVRKNSSTSKSVYVDVPDDVAGRTVYIFVAVLDEPAESNVKDAVGELVRRGVLMSHIRLLAIVAARPTLWNLSDALPKLTVLASCVDEVNKGQLVPGIGHLESRLVASHDHVVGSSTVGTVGKALFGDVQQRGAFAPLKSSSSQSLPDLSSQPIDPIRRRGLKVRKKKRPMKTLA